ncbi:uncharacterized protein GIQ15_02939 [Arthroderma uncinatum]|uniref:uncharacterized protein n=1 Tax=Arthroderma uncinatum TaxID=74035 RepID=UPI00144A6C1C|nr:uncharacterized protein GIQ15_02939 [Arthroderma uncinatum]KAF3483615.1 hypothetical protein GIQ15_02939 [Arthroderma uncinatum]
MTSRHRHRRIPSSGSATTTQTTASTASTTVQALNAHRMAPSQPSSALPSVRRTLFNSGSTHTSRRPASTTSSSTATDNHSSMPTDTATSSNGSSNALGGNRPSKSISKLGTSLSASSLDSGDIVARDKNGCYKVDIPILPPGVFGEEGEGGDSMEGIEHSGGAEMPIEEGGELAGRDKEKIDASFVEMMRHNRSRHVNGEPSEVFLLVQQNLRDRVLGLDEDKWMFEVDEEIKL